MKKFLFLLLLSASFAFAQSSTKYFIYFKDKGVDKTTKLSKSSTEYIQAINSFSKRSIERRIRSFGENIITFEDLPIKSDYIEAVKNSGAQIVWRLKWFNALSAYLTENQFQKILNFPFVDRIEKVRTIRYNKDKRVENNQNSLLKTYDSHYNFDYGASLRQVELSDVPIIHNAGFSGEGVLIGILDAGFAWENHPALKNRIVIAERDFVHGDNDTDDGDASHGTAVFSLIGGFDEGKIVSPAFSASFVVAKTEYIYTETHLEEDNYAAALEWMDSIGVDITNTSLGYSEFDAGEAGYTYSDMDGKTAIVTKASELAFERGILTISSAGNAGNSSWKHITAPSDGFNTIAVGAVNSNRKLASFSSVGPSYDGRIKPELVAQGVSCFYARAYSNDYAFGSGTSFSAPIVSGIAAQLLSAFPYLTNQQLRAILIEAADSTENPNNKYGYGLLSAKRALEFPNIRLPIAGQGEQTSSINRIFIDENGIVKDSVFLIYSLNSEEELHRQGMIESGNHRYRVPLYGSLGDKVNFWFEYLDSTLTLIRSPLVGGYSVIIGESGITLGIDENKKPSPIPNSFELSQNYPNPFNPLTNFVLSLPEASFITLNIYNILGEKVKTLASERFSAGNHNFTWDGSNDFGNKVSTGVYFYSAFSKANRNTKKMIFIR